MELGHVPNVNDMGMGNVGVIGRWFPGLPEKAFWLMGFGRIKVKWKGGIPLLAYRCSDCFSVELFAPPIKE